MSQQAMHITLIIFLIVLGICIVPFLNQYRKTLKALEDFAKSANENLDSITNDIHQITVHVNEVVDMAKETLALPAKLSRLLSNLIQVMPTLLSTQSSVTALMDGFRTAKRYFKRIKG
jgi:predicted PurR-regulated permease PerM